MAKTKVGMGRAAADAVTVLGQQIRLARLAKGWTAAELSETAGLSPTTVASIENGRGSAAIGTVFNLAVIVGVPLFGVDDPSELIRLRRRGEERLALMPSRASRPRMDSGDGLDF